MAETPQTGRNKTVLVTGGSGYIAGHLIKQLLERGYTVRATVRDVKRPEKVRHLTALAEGLGAQNRLSFVEADLESDVGWAEAVAGCGDGVFHVASPAPARSPTDETVLIRPAVEGTERVLRAASAHGVRRVVVTSSNSAVSHGLGCNTADAPFNENNWSRLDNPDDPITPYVKSKVMAERRAWELQAELRGPDGRQLELATICPTYVQGPLLAAHGDGSFELLKRLLEGRDPGVLDLQFNLVDVRDVVHAHIEALERPEAAGHRFLLTAESVRMQEIAKLVASEFNPPKGGYSVPTRMLPYSLVWLLARCDAVLRSVLHGVGKTTWLDGSKASRMLGFQYRPVRPTLVEMANALIDFGVVPDKRIRN